MATPLHAFHELEADQVPNRPGTYAIFNNRHLVYIGSAAHVRRRLRAQGLCIKRPRHITRFGPADRITIRYAAPHHPCDWPTRELRLIKRLRPPLNQNHT